MGIRHQLLSTLARQPREALSLQQKHVDGASIFASRDVYLATIPKGGTCAEVGVFKGDWSARILEVTKPARLHLIDTDLRRFRVRERFASHPEVECHEGLSSQVLASFPNAHFDWLYIDAGHDYASVRADATIAAAKVKPDGLLLFNDYIVWSHHEARPYGVVATVNEMCVNEGWRMVAFCLNSGMYCDVALARR